MQNYLKEWLLPSLIFFITAFLISFPPPDFKYSLDKPFIGEHDWNGVRYGNIARNYLRSNYSTPYLSQLENSGPQDKNIPHEIFTHYPPLLPLLISFSYFIFGVSEASTRIVPLFATSGTVVIIFLILRLYLGAKAKLIRIL